jgi:PAS domain S-box-containing protein
MMVDKSRVANLIDYVRKLMNKENGKELYLRYKEDIERVTPQEVFEVFFTQLQKGIEVNEILIYLDKVINVFYKSLTEYKWSLPVNNSFLGYLMKENQAMVSRLDNIKVILKEKDFFSRKFSLIPHVKELQAFDAHYLKKENILFPYLEKKADKFNGLSIMWALHDETRARLIKVIGLLESETNNETEIKEAIGGLFFAMHGLKLKEELILFPAACEMIKEEEWTDMHRQSLEYDFPFVEKPELKYEEKVKSKEIHNFISDFNQGFLFKTETGELDFEQLLSIFNALPVDMTFVDENDKVRFFTRPKDRIFPRSPAVIGRDVKNCHPPESVHIVQEIIESFRLGKKNSATFWIRVKGKIILIQYFSLRDSKGDFRGTLEVSQDITEIKALEGERRLLSWE